MMKRLLSATLLLLSMTAANAQNSLTDVAPDNTGMDLTAKQWTQNVVMGWNLGNSLESQGGETGWGNPRTTQQMIKDVKAQGFNAIRIPVRWTEHLSDKTNMVVSNDWLARVKEIVDWCLAEDMYVIINAHHEAWLDRHPQKATQTENNKKLAALWKCIATYFRDYDQRLAFAGTNETISLDAKGEEYWGEPTAEYQEVQNSYNQAFIDAVRATGGKNYYRNLVVQTYACSAWNGFKGFVIPTDLVEERLSVEVHNYDPYEYAGGGTYYYWGTKYKDMGYKVPSSNEQSMIDYMNRLRSTWSNKGLGIVIGEYGATCHYTADNKQVQMENLQYWYQTIVSAMRERGFAGFVWDNNVFGNGTEKFGIFRRSATGMTVGNEYALKGICEGSGTEYKESGSGGGQGDQDLGGGTTFWEGDGLMDWGNGLQLSIPGSDFQGYGKDVVMQLSYTLDYTDYNMIQFFYGDWGTNPSFIIDGNTYEKEYVPSDVHGASNGDVCVSTITFSEDVYNQLVSKGLAIQGHGVRMNKVVLGAPTAISTISTPSCDGGHYYSLNGMRSNTPTRGIYIKNGKKYIVRKG